jgi:DNA helicase-2/ATP-dependent DNA helicase PcrA
VPAPQNSESIDPLPAPAREAAAGVEEQRPRAPHSSPTRGQAPDVERAEVRDVLAWTRLLADPADASAVVRALARPPIELRQVDLARVIQIARRRKLDMVAALRAALESPQVPPEARSRIQRFLELHGAARAALDEGRPDLLARAALGAEREPPADGAEVREGDGALRDMQRILLEEVLTDVSRLGASLTELRLDTDIDIAHGVARYLELVKLSALAQRAAEQGLQDALADVNARLLTAATALEREILQSSPLDGTLLAAESASARLTSTQSATASDRAGDDDPAGTAVDAGANRGYDERAARAQAVSPRGEPSLAPFLPRKGGRGGGLALSASDIETYRSCPLRYKFARVLRIPTQATLGQRFGIVVHQVLERYHSAGGHSLEQLLDLLDACWRRGGFGHGEAERELRLKAQTALERYHARLHAQESEPVWFERQFSLQVGPHHLRGRVDRVDLLHGEREEYELIDYKTSRPKPAQELEHDTQLSLYALAASESWQLQAPSRAYYYVLDDLKVTLPGPTDFERVREVVLQVGEGILSQRFQATPSKAACSLCDFRIVCPAAER